MQVLLNSNVAAGFRLTTPGLHSQEQDRHALATKADRVSGDGPRGSFGLSPPGRRGAQAAHRGPGSPKRVPYSKSGDPAGAATGENALKIRPLVVDGAVKEWTTGESHDVTDRSFVVRRVLRLNDALPDDKPLPGDKQSHWV